MDLNREEIAGGAIAIFLIAIIILSLFSFLALGNPAGDGDYWYSKMGKDGDRPIHLKKGQVLRTETLYPVRQQIDWITFWDKFEKHAYWKLEGDRGSGWEDASSALKIRIDERPTLDPYSRRRKLTLDFVAPVSANYRLTFAIDQDAREYVYKEGIANYTLKYKDYEISFDWSDMLSISGIVFSHGVKEVSSEKWFWFRASKNNVPKGASISLDPTLIAYSSVSDGHLAHSTGSFYATWVASSATLFDSIYIWVGQQGSTIISRGFAFFDTSSIPDESVIVSAYVSMYLINYAASWELRTVHIQSGMPTYPHDPVVLGDWNKTHYTTTCGSAVLEESDEGSHVQFPLNSDGLNLLNLTGTTKYIVRTEGDVAGQDEGIDYLVFQSSEYGTGTDPFLSVTYISYSGLTDIENTNNVYSTEFSYQRKTFYHNGLHWAFYAPYVASGDQMAKYATSPDGSSWTTHNAFEVYLGYGYHFSLFFNNTHVAVCRTTFLTTIPPESSPWPTLSYRLGVPNSDGSITWCAAWQTVRKGNELNYDLYPMIILDSLGYAWIATYSRSTDFYGTCYINSMQDGTWSGSSIYLYDHDASNQERFFSLVPLGAGYVYWIRSKANSIFYGKLWNTVSWSSEETILTPAPTNDGTQYSAIGRGGDVSLCYVNSTIVQEIYRESSWNSPVTLFTSSTETFASAMLYNFDHYAFGFNTTAELLFSRMYNTTWNAAVSTGTSTTQTNGLSGFYRNNGQVLGYEFVDGNSRVDYGFITAISEMTTGEALGFEIDNMDADDWLFAEYKPYNMKCWFMNIDNFVEFRFYDGQGTLIEIKYDLATQDTTVLSGSEKVFIVRNKIVAIISSEENVYVNVTFPTYLTINIADKLDVDFEIRGTRLDGNDTGWVEKASNYANIYRKGGLMEDDFYGVSGRTVGGNIFELYAANDSIAITDTWWRNLQHYSTRMRFPIPGVAGTYGGVWHYWGMSYYANAHWNTGFWMKYSWTTAESSSNFQYVNLTCRFYINYDLIKEEFNITVFNNEGTNATEPGYDLYIDMWFSSANGSTYGGMRIGAYEFPMYNTQNVWWRWQGDTWGIYGIGKHDSICYTKLLDDYDNVVFAQNVSLVNLWNGLYYPMSTETNWTAYQRRTETENMVFAYDTMMGISTPPFSEPKIPVVTMTSYSAFMKYVVNPLVSFFSPVTDFITGLFSKAVLGFVDVMITALDGVLFYLTGQNNVLRTFISSFGSLISSFLSNLGFIPYTITQGTTHLGNFASWAFNSTTNFLSYFAGILAFVFNPAFGFFQFFSDIFSIAIAWLVGGTYTNSYGQVFDYTYLQGFSYAGFSGGQFIIAVIFVAALALSFLFGLRDTVATGNLECLLAPINLIWRIIKAFLWLGDIVYGMIMTMVRAIIAFYHALRDTPPKIAGTG